MKPLGSAVRFKHSIRLGVAAAVALAVATAATSASAVKIPVKDDIFIDLKLLLQPWSVLKYDPSLVAPQREFTSDFYLRRTRILLGGQITKWVSFFMETDMPNWGKGGNWALSTTTTDTTTGAVTGIKENTSFFVQDAYVSFDIHEAIHVAFGMLMLPFVHNSRQSAASIHTLDYHVELLRYPSTGDKVWRSTGIELRGLLWKKRIDYRVAVTNGVAHKAVTIAAKKDSTTGQAIAAVKSNTKDCPRFTGRVGYNFFDAEEGFFFGGTYFGKKKILSVGIAGDGQPEVFGAGRGYIGIGGDIFLDYPLRENLRISGQFQLVYYGGEYNPKRGIGFGLDAGVAIGKWEPMLAFDYFMPPDSDFEDQFLAIRPGLAWWLYGHNANLKLEIGVVKNEGVAMEDLAITTALQTQLLF